MVYGSNDAGKTVHASEPSLNKTMRNVGKHLGLAKHQLGSATLYSPGDIGTSQSTEFFGIFSIFQFFIFFPKFTINTKTFFNSFTHVQFQRVTKEKTENSIFWISEELCLLSFLTATTPGMFLIHRNSETNTHDFFFTEYLPPFFFLRPGLC